MEQEVNNNLGTFIALLFIGTIFFGAMAALLLTAIEGASILNKNK